MYCDTGMSKYLKKTSLNLGIHVIQFGDTIYTGTTGHRLQGMSKDYLLAMDED